MSSRIVVIRDDGTEIDVTEGVKVTYDAVRMSMDWGSGFLDLEEIGHIVGLARAAEFPDFEEAVRSAYRAYAPLSRHVEDGRTITHKESPDNFRRRLLGEA